jgi:hypothetical protein
MGPSMEQMRHHSSTLLLSSSEITKETAKYTFYWNIFFFFTDSNLTFKDLLPCIDVVLRVALNRLHLDATCLGKLISATTPHRPKAQESGVDVINVLFDILGDGFRMKTKMAPSTIKVLIEVFLLRLMCK